MSKRDSVQRAFDAFGKANFQHGAFGLVVAIVLVAGILAVGGSRPQPALAGCDDPFVYDAHIDEIIPLRLVDALESAIPPLQPGDPRTHHLRPWSGYCDGGSLPRQ